MTAYIAAAILFAVVYIPLLIVAFNLNEHSDLPSGGPTGS